MPGEPVTRPLFCSLALSGRAARRSPRGEPRASCGLDPCCKPDVTTLYDHRWPFRTLHPGSSPREPPHLPPDFQRDAPPSCPQPASRSMSSNIDLLRPRRFDGLDGLLRVLRCGDRSPPPILGFEPFQGEPRLTAAPSPRLGLSGPSELSPRRPPCRVTATPAFSPFSPPRAPRLRGA
jgi:hypothetical protein